MILYILAALGVLFLLLCVMVAGFNVMMWLNAAVPYETSRRDLQRFLASWGRALGDRGRIVVTEPTTGLTVRFEKHLHKNRDDELVLRCCRNTDPSRKHFETVRNAFTGARIPCDVELTPRRKPRALRVRFSVEDPLMPSAAAHAASVALTAMGASSEGSYEVQCQGRHRPDYVTGEVDVIPWTRGYRSGFRLGQLFTRLLGR